MEASLTTICPECGSEKSWKDGIPTTKYGIVQRYVCRDCGYRFRDKSLNESYESESLDDFDTLILNTPSGLLSKCQIGVSQTKAAKNLVKVEPMESRLPGATKQAEIKGKLVNFSWRMTNQGYSLETIRTYSSAVRILMDRGADILDPESVKAVIAKQSWSLNRKQNVINAYSLFLKTSGSYWEKPKCNVVRKLHFIPLEEELDALIAGCGKKTSTFLRLLKETAMRAGEAKSILWTEVDTERRLITLNNPEKGSNPRVWKVSAKLIGMLNSMPKQGAKVFGTSLVSSMRTSFCKSRKRLAKKLQNPRLLRISFHTFRHWKATAIQHQTHDPWIVKEFLGHKSLRSTEIYITYEKTIYESNSDEYTVKVVKDPNEIRRLLEVGFEFVCEKDDLLFLRKRK